MNQEVNDYLNTFRNESEIVAMDFNNDDWRKLIPSKQKTLHHGIIITQSNDEEYVVYSGHTKSLKARAREHMCGDKGTGCLALHQYPDLRQFQWSFIFLDIGDTKEPSPFKKVYRAGLEGRKRVADSVFGIEIKAPLRLKEDIFFVILLSFCVFL